MKGRVGVYFSFLTPTEDLSLLLYEYENSNKLKFCIFVIMKHNANMIIHSCEYPPHGWWCIC